MAAATTTTAAVGKLCQGTPTTTTTQSTNTPGHTEVAALSPVC